MAKWFLLANAATTLAMVGLIWFVQIVHYPLFAHVGETRFAAYEQLHQRLTTFVVAPIMLVEFATAVLMLWFRPRNIGLTPVCLGIFLVGAIWLMTYLVQVPQHHALSGGLDLEMQKSLVSGNWWRTAAWTIRGLLVIWMLSEAVPVSSS